MARQREKRDKLELAMQYSHKFSKRRSTSCKLKHNAAHRVLVQEGSVGTDTAGEEKKASKGRKVAGGEKRRSGWDKERSGWEKETEGVASRKGAGGEKERSGRGEAGSGRGEEKERVGRSGGGGEQKGSGRGERTCAWSTGGNGPPHPLCNV
jgi:hypothetical protein